MRIRRRAKRRTSQSQPTFLEHARLPLTALIVAVLGLWVMLPFGGVTLWARDAILLSVLAAIGLLGVLGGATRSNGPTATQPKIVCVSWWTLGMATFLAWALFQLLPLPAALVHHLQPGWHVFNRGLPWDTDVRALAVNRIDGYYSLVLWVAPAVFAAVLARLCGERRTARVLAHIIAGLGLFQACAALAIPGMPSSWWDTLASRRLLGTFPNPNAFGGLLALTVPVTLGLLLTLQSRLLDVLNGRWKRLFALPARHHLLLIEWIWIFLAFVAQAVTLIASGSRGAVSATLVAVVILFASYIVASKSSRGIALQMTALLLAVVLALATGGGLYLLLQRFDIETLLDTGLSGRIALWRATLHMIGAFPLGVGAGAFPVVFTAFEPRRFGAARIYYAHNDYLQWAAEFGIPGFILLCFLLAGLMRRGFRTIHIPGARNSAWIWRGAAAGLIAALVHSVVDFNLTVYPGVRVIFFMVCGLMLGVPRQQQAHGSARQAARYPVADRRSRWSIRRIALVTTACLIVGVWLVRPAIGRIRTAYRVEGARRALELPPDKVFWLPPPWFPPDLALVTLAEARERMPQTARYAYWLAVGRLMHHRHERREGIENLRRQHNGMMDVDDWHLEQMVDLAMRWEFRQALKFAGEHLEHAVALAPWDADMRAFAGYVNARLSDWEAGMPEGKEYRRATVCYIDGALRLAPHDVSVLMRTCRAAASLFNASIRSQDNETKAYAERQLISSGRHAVEIDRSKTVEVLEVWQTAGMAIDRLADMDALPLPILREVYSYLSGQQQAYDAQRALKHLTARVAEEKPSNAGIDRLFLEREKYRWLIWDLNWQAYRDAFQARRDVWQQRQNEALTRENGAVSPNVTYRIHMRAVDQEIGLHVEHLLALSQLEWERGASHDAMMLLSRALALHAGYQRMDVDTLQAFKKWRDTVAIDSQHYAARWLECRLLRADKQPRAAALSYRRLRDHPRLPLRLRHRIDLETAAAWTEAGNTDAAMEVIREIIRDGVDDPDALRAWIEYGLDETPFRGPDGVITSAAERLASLRPDHELGVRYMGERVELVGLTIVPYGAAGSGQTNVRSYWRFYDRVPGDLRLRVESRAADGYTFARRISWFGREMPDRFSAGEPRAGSILILNTAMPAQARAGDRLILSMHANGRRLASDEGLLRLDINEWTRLLAAGL